MDVAFATNRLQRCYQEERVRNAAWPLPVAHRFVQRVDQIRAAAEWRHLFSLHALGLHPLKARRSGQYAMTLHGRWRLIVAYDETERVVSILEVSNHYDD
jgi:plasmid maintenance system killer protein